MNSGENTQNFFREPSKNYRRRGNVRNERNNERRRVKNEAKATARLLQSQPRIERLGDLFMDTLSINPLDQTPDQHQMMLTFSQWRAALARASVVGNFDH